MELISLWFLSYGNIYRELEECSHFDLSIYQYGVGPFQNLFTVPLASNSQRKRPAICTFYQQAPNCFLHLAMWNDIGYKTFTILIFITITTIVFITSLIIHIITLFFNKGAIDIHFQENWLCLQQNLYIKSTIHFIHVY